MKKMKRLIITTMLMVLTGVSITARPDFKEDSRYYIVCQQFPNGCVADGASAGQQTPLTYLTQRTTDEASLWTLTEAASGQYYIQNAKTGQYVTYDGVREGNNRR